MKKLFWGFSLSLLIFSISFAAQAWNVIFYDLVRGGLEDCWGYYANGREYALICKSPTLVNGNAVQIIDVTDPFNSYAVATVFTL